MSSSLNRASITRQNLDYTEGGAVGPGDGGGPLSSGAVPAAAASIGAAGAVAAGSSDVETPSRDRVGRRGSAFAPRETMGVVGSAGDSNGGAACRDENHVVPAAGAVGEDSGGGRGKSGEWFGRVVTCKRFMRVTYTTSTCCRCRWRRVNY